MPKHRVVARLRRLAPIALALILLSGGAVTLNVLVAGSAVADTGGYPWVSAPCEFGASDGSSCSNPDQTDYSGDMYDWYWDENGDGQFTGTPCGGSNPSGECFDTWGYQYRNCTSYVAWKIAQEFPGTSAAGWGNAYQWSSKAPSNKVHAASGYTPQEGDIAVWGSEVGDGFGHVAYVASVSSGVATFDEYNVAGTGAFTDTYTSANHPGGHTAPDYYIHLGVPADSTDSTSPSPPTLPSSPLTATSTPDGRQDVFWKGSDGKLTEAYWDGAAWHRFALGFGTMYSAPTTVIQPSTGYIEVFWEGASHNLYAVTWNSVAWVGPWNLGYGTVYSQPAAASYGSQIDVFWTNSDHKLEEAVWNGSAWVHFSMGSMFWNLGSAPTAYALPDGEQDVYWEDTAGNLIEAVWNGSAWVGFHIPAGLIKSPPTAAWQPSSNFLDVFWRDPASNNLHEFVWNGGAWVGFNMGQGTVATPPAATAWQNQVDVFWTDSSNNLREAVYNGSAWVYFTVPVGTIPNK